MSEELFKSVMEVLTAKTESPTSDLEKLIKEAGWKLSGLGKNSYTRDALLELGNFDLNCTIYSSENSASKPVISYLENDEGNWKRIEKFNSKNALEGLKKLKIEVKNFKTAEDFEKASWKFNTKW